MYKTGIYSTTLPRSEQDQVVQLTGLARQVLFDTGAQVSLLSHKWLKSNLPGATILEVGKLLDPCNRL